MDAAKMIRCPRGRERSDLSPALPRFQDCCLTEGSACVDHCLVLSLGGGWRRAGLCGLLLSSPEALGWTRLMVCILERSSHESSNQKDFKKEKKNPQEKVPGYCLPPAPAVAAQLRLICTSFLVEFFKKDLSVGVSAVVQIFTSAPCLTLCRKTSKLPKSWRSKHYSELANASLYSALACLLCPSPPVSACYWLNQTVGDSVVLGPFTPKSLRTDLLRRGTFFHTVGVRRARSAQRALVQSLNTACSMGLMSTVLQSSP